MGFRCPKFRARIAKHFMYPIYLGLWGFLFPKELGRPHGDGDREGSAYIVEKSTCCYYGGSYYDLSCLALKLPRD
ncbi:Uncharacterized protein HZ326_12159 [Fusarium oxysporum f. sp. albedinis]|nr:Uncharacterized protein HZ326_12159 [Fusarium oxysporum f. sp. albedinis]